MSKKTPATLIAAAWLDGYEDAIRHVFPTSSHDPKVLSGLMSRANERIDAYVAIATPLDVFLCDPSCTCRLT